MAIPVFPFAPRYGARPRLQSPIEARPTQLEGAPALELFLGSEAKAVLAQGTWSIAQMLDGTRDLRTLQAAIAARYSRVLPIEQLHELLRALWEAGLLCAPEPVPWRLPPRTDGLSAPPSTRVGRPAPAVVWIDPAAADDATLVSELTQAVARLPRLETVLLLEAGPSVHTLTVATQPTATASAVVVPDARILETLRAALGDAIREPVLPRGDRLDRLALALVDARPAEPPTVVLARCEDGVPAQATDVRDAAQTLARALEVRAALVVVVAPIPVSDAPVPVIPSDAAVGVFLRALAPSGGVPQRWDAPSGRVAGSWWAAAHRPRGAGA